MTLYAVLPADSFWFLVSGTNFWAMNVPPCGSAITAILTKGASKGGASTLPPSSVALSASASASSILCGLGVAGVQTVDVQRSGLIDDLRALVLLGLPDGEDGALRISEKRRGAAASAPSAPMLGLPTIVGRGTGRALQAHHEPGAGPRMVEPPRPLQEGCQPIRSGARWQSAWSATRLQIT